MGKQTSLGQAMDALESAMAGIPSPKRPARRRVATPARKPEGMPSLEIDRVAELLIQRKALMAVAMRAGQTHEAMAELMDAVHDIDLELGAAPLSSAESAGAALRYVQEQFLLDRHNEPLGIVDTTVLHLIAELGDFVRSYPRCTMGVGDFNDDKFPF